MARTAEIKKAFKENRQLRHPRKKSSVGALGTQGVAFDQEGKRVCMGNRRKILERAEEN